MIGCWRSHEFTESCGRPRLIAFNNSYFDTILDQDAWELFQRSAEHAEPSDAPGA